MTDQSDTDRIADFNDMIRNARSDIMDAIENVLDSLSDLKMELENAQDGADDTLDNCISDNLSAIDDTDADLRRVSINLVECDTDKGEGNRRRRSRSEGGVSGMAKVIPLTRKSGTMHLEQPLKPIVTSMWMDFGTEDERRPVK